MKRVVCFGEIMLRLSPNGYERFVQSTNFEATYGGGEANVSVSLANFGLDAAFVSKLPANVLGQAAVNELRKYGVDTSQIVRGGERLGIYYLEKGASQRPSRVIYDRKYSAISEANSSDFEWKKILKGADWFHFTGITPALSDDMAKITAEACEAAKKLGLFVSCDLNFRKNLWSTEKANQVMSPLMQYVDLCIANEEDAENVFGIKADDTNVSDGKLSHEGYKSVSKKLREKFGFTQVAITLRGSISASDNIWSAMLDDGKNVCFSKSYPIHVVDRVGGGDSFGAGLIYSILNQYSSQDAIEFAVAASCLKHTIEGDFNQVTGSEVNALAKGEGSGRIQR